MTDYMKEAERLLNAYVKDERDFFDGFVVDSNKSRAALLAHIQRGEVPEGWQVVPREPTPEMLDAYVKNNARFHSARSDWEAMLAAAPAPDHFRDAAKMVPEFSDSARAALLWVLWHHQGGSSPIGQPIRFALGMGQHEHLNDWQVAEAKRWGALCGLGQGDCSEPAPAPAEVPMPEPDGTAEANIKPLPGGGYQTGYVDAWSEPLMRTYGAACRAAGEAAGYARAANWLRTSAEKHAEENGYHEPDTGSFVFAGRAAEEWNNSVLELADEMEAALRGEVKP